LALDYYRNNIIHHLVPEALLASAVRSLGGLDGRVLDVMELQSRTLLLSRTFKIEFIYRVDLPFTEIFNDSIQRIAEYDIVELTDEGVRIRDEKRAKGLVEFAANMIAHLVDAYRMVLSTLPEEAKRSDSKKDLVLNLLERVRAGTLSGELACVEAASKLNVENAVALVQDRGGLTFDDDGQPVVDASWVQGEGADLLAVLKDARLPT